MIFVKAYNRFLDNTNFNIEIWASFPHRPEKCQVRVTFIDLARKVFKQHNYLKINHLKHLINLHMYNPDTQQIFGTRHRTSKTNKNTTQKTKKISNTDPTKEKMGGDRCSRNGKKFFTH